MSVPVIMIVVSALPSPADLGEIDVSVGAGLQASKTSSVIGITIEEFTASSALMVTDPL